LPYSNGIWYDVGEVDGQFINNWVEGVGNIHRPLVPDRPWPSESGFFFEISKGAICAGNVFVNCDQGIFILNSSNVQIYQNTFVNSIATIARNARTPGNDRLFGWHSSTGPDVNEREGHIFVNNLLTGDENYQRPLLYIWQPDTLCKQLSRPMLKQFDNNVFYRYNEKSSIPLILWSPSKKDNCQLAAKSLDEIQKMHPDFLIQSQYFTDNIAPFKSCELGNYQILQSFPGNKSATLLPVEIVKLLGITKNVKYLGAYPPSP